jgi:hypothetical protein
MASQTSTAFGVRLPNADFQAIDRACIEAPSLTRTLIVQAAVSRFIRGGGLAQMVEAQLDPQTKTPA